MTQPKINIWIAIGILILAVLLVKYSGFFSISDLQINSDTINNAIPSITSSYIWVIIIFVIGLILYSLWRKDGR